MPPSIRTRPGDPMSMRDTGLLQPLLDHPLGPQVVNATNPGSKTYLTARNQLIPPETGRMIYGRGPGSCMLKQLSYVPAYYPWKDTVWIRPPTPRAQCMPRVEIDIIKRLKDADRSEFLWEMQSGGPLKLYDPTRLLTIYGGLNEFNRCQALELPFPTTYRFDWITHLSTTFNHYMSARLERSQSSDPWDYRHRSYLDRYRSYELWFIDYYYQQQYATPRLMNLSLSLRHRNVQPSWRRFDPTAANTILEIE